MSLTHREAVEIGEELQKQERARQGRKPVKKPAKKKASRQLKTYTIISDNDGNDSFEVKAVDDADAAHKALMELGWWVAKL